MLSVAVRPASAEEPPQRLVAIDNVCAWPNLVTLREGGFLAFVFNQPNHARTEGDVDCWHSADGQLWTRRSGVTRHEPRTVRMNHAAGLNTAGEVVVLVNGWDKIDPERSAASRPLPTHAYRSPDGGKSWEDHGPVFAPVPELSHVVPFGDILQAADGDLVVGAYAFSNGKGNIYAARSHDGGRTWPEVNPIVRDKHCEAAMLHTGSGRWLAASRRFGILDLELFASDDDARSWKSLGTLDVKPVSSAHLLELSDGRILLTYGDRGPAAGRGIAARTSRDGGRTWTDPQLLVPVEKTDCGYPDALELTNRRVLIAYYAGGIAQHQRYHMGVLNLTFDELR
jgi:hypothetical protein